jgi:hypothetical protein
MSGLSVTKSWVLCSVVQTRVLAAKLPQHSHPYKQTQTNLVYHGQVLSKVVQELLRAALQAPQLAIGVVKLHVETGLYYDLERRVLAA